MASVSYTPRALADLERLCDFLAETDPRAASQTIDLVLDAVAILETSPHGPTRRIRSSRARDIARQIGIYRPVPVRRRAGPGSGACRPPSARSGLRRIKRSAGRSTRPPVSSPPALPTA